MDNRPVHPSFGRALVLFARAAVFRCPLCWQAIVLQSWFKLKDRCPSCDFLFARGESGCQAGSMALNLMLPLITWFFSFLGILILT